MANIITIIQAVAAILLMAVILVQNKGAGLAGVFGGSSAIYRTKRGLEKHLHLAAIILTVLFVAVSIANLLV